MSILPAHLLRHQILGICGKSSVKSRFGSWQVAYDDQATLSCSLGPGLFFGFQVSPRLPPFWHSGSLEHAASGPLPAHVLQGIFCWTCCTQSSLHVLFLLHKISPDRRFLAVRADPLIPAPPFGQCLIGEKVGEVLLSFAQRYCSSWIFCCSRFFLLVEKPPAAGV